MIIIQIYSKAIIFTGNRNNNEPCTGTGLERNLEQFSNL